MMPLRGLLLVGFTIASAPVCFFRPFYGIILWVVFAFLNPHAYAWTYYDALPWATVVAVPTLLGLLVFERRFDRLLSREVVLLMILWTWFTVTTLASTQQPELQHHAVETWERWNFVSKILLMALATVPIVHTFDRLRYLTLTIAACFGFFIVKALPFLIATDAAFRLYGPERSMIADNTDFGLALNMTLPMYFYLAQTETSPWLKRLLWVLFVITIPAIFFTYSRGALVGLVGVFTVLILQSRRRLALIPVGVIGLLIALLLAPESWQGRMNLASENTLDNSAQSRLDAWAYSRALAADYPITGGGFATFTEELYTRYWPGRIGTIYGPHSVYFQVLAEHGYVGLTLYLALVLSCVFSTWQLRRAAKQRGDPAIGLYAHMFQASLVGFLISGLFLGRAYLDYFFTIVACISVLGQIAKQRWATTESVREPLQPALPGGLRPFKLHGPQLPEPRRR